MKNPILFFPLFLLAACNPQVQNSEISSDQSSPSIVGGQVVDKEIFAKHVVAIYNLDLGYRCTGTLISNNVVLTAAHCINMGTRDSYVVYFAKNSQSRGIVSRKVSDLRANSHYKPEAYDKRNDVGVLRFKGTLPAGYEPMPLPTAKDLLSLGDSFYATGYGTVTARKNVINKDGGVLRYTTQKFPKTPLKTDQSQFVVDQTNGRGICYGDSGGPAFVKQGDRRLLIGVASAVYSVDPVAKARADFDVCRHKAIYTSTFYYLNWIRNTSVELR